MVCKCGPVNVTGLQKCVRFDVIDLIYCSVYLSALLQVLNKESYKDYNGVTNQW